MRDWNGPNVAEFRAAPAIEAFMKAMIDVQRMLSAAVAIPTDQVLSLRFIEMSSAAVVAADALREAGIDRVSFDVVLAPGSPSFPLGIHMEIRIGRLIAGAAFTKMELQLARDANAIIEHKFRSLITKATP